jgi:hypothetical protein
VGAKLVLIGDHRQLGAVGPGGALQGLVARHPDSVHYLMDNRRQHDEQEREALGEVRDGQVAEALSWYERQGRLHAIANRDDAVQGAVDAWAEDVAAGHHTALYAWRRANVAALNGRARTWMGAAGQLSGPEVVCPGGLAYRAGDQVVTLAPGPGGTLVTSQRATVVAVDPPAILVRTTDSRVVRLAGEEASAERLGYGYATTVHRAQGATVGRAHLLADGGGRELAYVAMSRARESTHVWVVADDPRQAVEDLARDWSARRAPTWAIDTGHPAQQQTEESPSVPSSESHVRTVALVKARMETAEAGFVKVKAPDWNQAIAQARSRLRQAEQAKADLANGAGVYQDSEPGRAVRDLGHAQSEMDYARREAQQAPRWRDRRTAAKQVAVWTERQAAASQGWQTHVAPEAARVDSHIQQLQDTVTELVIRAERQRIAERAIVERMFDQHHGAIELAHTLCVYRDHIDEIRPPAAEPAPPTVQHRLYIPPPTVEPAHPQIGIGM